MHTSGGENGTKPHGRDIGRNALDQEVGTWNPGCIFRSGTHVGDKRWLLQSTGRDAIADAHAGSGYELHARTVDAHDGSGDADGGTGNADAYA